MTQCYFLRTGGRAGLFLLGWLLASPAGAQAPAWTAVATGMPAVGTSLSAINDMATDAAGNVFVTGNFTGRLTLGSVVLTSAGFNDFFVAKYLPATATWAWAVRGGGSGDDFSRGIAVSGSSVYITGDITNNLANANGVLLESGSPGAAPVLVPQAGSTSTVSSDLLVAKYTDLGNAAALTWTQTGGGTGQDQAYRLATSGPNVYVTGALTNNLANAQAVVFGGTGTTGGTVPQYGASAVGLQDVVLAKYVDNGPTATLAWTQVGGGQGTDQGRDLAVSGAAIYVAGFINNDRANSQQVVFGGAGTTPGTAPQYGAAPNTSADLLVAKYLDNGSSATVAWTQVGGGTGSDQYFGIAVSGPNLYVTGSFDNNSLNGSLVLLGGSGSAAGTVPQYGTMPNSFRDLLLTKYVDNGPAATVAWTQAAGGAGLDLGYDIAVRGTSLYVTGSLDGTSTGNANVLFGAAGTAPATQAQAGASATYSTDVLVARYIDNGPTATVAWTQVAGGAGSDYGQSVALGSGPLYVGGLTVPATTFGSLTISAPAGASTSFLASMGNAVLATAPAAAALPPRLYPNPAVGPATLNGAGAGAAVRVFDALGRCVATATADARGTAALPGGLRPGVYVVRAGAGTARWVVE